MRSEALLRTELSFSLEKMTEVVPVIVKNRRIQLHVEVEKTGDISVRSVTGRLLFAGVWRLSYVHYFGEVALDWNILDTLEEHVRKVVERFYPHLLKVDREVEATKEARLGQAAFKKRTGTSA